MLVTSKVRDLILKGEPAEKIEQQAVEEGMITLHQSALAKLRDGFTSIEEVIRETKVT
jgi:type II secretory ATPase GspE/PulE/Tfp pilus assembly ATPase PilB-like protein